MRARISPLFYCMALGLVVSVMITASVLLAERMPERIELRVPYLSQVFGGAWVSPWDEACEEAALTMIQAYYKGLTRITVKDAKPYMQDMINWENRQFKKNDDTTAEQTMQLLYAKTDMGGFIKRNPTVNEIKVELVKQWPVIALLDMYELYGEKHLGDGFHVIVISGYDDRTKEFIVQDPARARTRYSYDRVMKALGDYDPKTKEATGPATIIFTSP